MQHNERKKHLVDKKTKSLSRFAKEGNAKEIESQIESEKERARG